MTFLVTFLAAVGGLTITCALAVAVHIALVERRDRRQK